MSDFIPYAEYLPQVDIVYVRLRDAQIARTLNLDHWRNVDLDAEGGRRRVHRRDPRRHRTRQGPGRGSRGAIDSGGQHPDRAQDFRVTYTGPAAA